MIYFVRPSSWLNTELRAQLSNLPNGWYRLTVIVNGVPSHHEMIRIEYIRPDIGSIAPATGPSNGGQTVDIGGVFLEPLANVMFGAAPATILSVSDTLLRVRTPPGGPGPVTVFVNTAGGTAITSYDYVLSVPVAINAHAASATSVVITWTAVHGATAYDIIRTADGVNYQFVTQITTNEATDSTAVADTAYLYKVRALGSGAASDYSVPDLATTVLYTAPFSPGSPILAVTFDEFRTAVDAVRELAGLQPATLTDPTLTPGVILIKRVHMTELRAALNEARLALGLSAVMFGETITAGSTTVKFGHLLELAFGML